MFPLVKWCRYALPDSVVASSLPVRKTNSSARLACPGRRKINGALARKPLGLASRLGAADGADGTLELDLQEIPEKRVILIPHAPMSLGQSSGKNIAPRKVIENGPGVTHAGKPCGDFRLDGIEQCGAGQKCPDGTGLEGEDLFGKIGQGFGFKYIQEIVIEESRPPIGGHPPESLADKHQTAGPPFGMAANPAVWLLPMFCSAIIIHQESCQLHSTRIWTNCRILKIMP